MFFLKPEIPLLQRFFSAQYSTKYCYCFIVLRNLSPHKGYYYLSLVSIAERLYYRHVPINIIFCLLFRFGIVVVLGVELGHLLSPHVYILSFCLSIICYRSRFVTKSGKDTIPSDSTSSHCSVCLHQSLEGTAGGLS